MKKILTVAAALTLTMAISSCKQTRTQVYELLEKQAREKGERVRSSTGSRKPYRNTVPAQNPTTT